MIDEKSIVIVGAGLAGLAAASKLIENGHKDLLIVEATSRIGGRVETLSLSDDLRIELGAQWLHGGGENPIYNWLDELDLIEGSEKSTVEFEGTYRSQYGDELCKEAFELCIKSLIEARNNLYNNKMRTDLVPIEVFRAAHKNNLTNPVLKGVDMNLLDALLRWFELYEAIDNSCEDLSLLSIRAYHEWDDFDNGKLVKLKGGWKSVVDKMVSKVGEEKIMLASAVKGITTINSTSGRKVVRVEHDKGLIDCDHVIMTLSLGAFKSLAPSFFEPSLANWRTEAISKLGFDVVNKVFIQFEKPFLAEEKGLKMLWVKDKRFEEEKKLPEWSRYLTGFDLVNNQPNSLVGWVGGKGALKLERLSEEELKEDCSNILAAFLPDKKAPKLVSVKQSKWGTNGFIRGAYSYHKIGSEGVNLEDLWSPIVDKNEPRIPRILFAGEATAGSLYATAHGAIISGWREAHRLIKRKKV